MSDPSENTHARNVAESSRLYWSALWQPESVMVSGSPLACRSIQSYVEAKGGADSLSTS